MPVRKLQLSILLRFSDIFCFFVSSPQICEGKLIVMNFIINCLNYKYFIHKKLFNYKFNITNIYYVRLTKR